MTPYRRLPASPEGSLAAAVFDGLLRRLHLIGPSDLAAAAGEEARPLGVEELAIYLADYDDMALVPMPGPHTDRAAVSVDGSVAGRAYRTTTILQVDSDDPPSRPVLWLPLIDGTVRLGVVEMVFHRGFGELSDDLVTVCERYADLLAHSLETKKAYGDVIEFVRRRRPMSVAGELVWRLLPPPTFATDRVVITGFLEPTYDVGGDCFDYALNGDVLHVAVLDAMGHGVAAAGLSAFALSAYRQSRLGQADLPESVAAVDAAIAEQFSAEQFVTAVFAELDLDDGRLTWVSAGHPPPLLLREGRLVRQLTAPPATPLGLGVAGAGAEVAEQVLQPADRLLFYTDGLPEARLPDGEFLTVARLVDYLERQEGHSPAEALRRLRLAVLEHQDGRLQDDASAVLVEWRRGSERSLLPARRPGAAPPGPGVPQAR